MRRAAIVLLLAVALMGCGRKQRREPEPEGTLAKAEAFYASQPRMRQPVPHSATPEGLPDVRSATCGACHQEIYAEWRVSTHSHAWTDDAQFMAELEKSRKQGVDWMCVNCHTPVVTQLETVVVGLEGDQLHQPIREANPVFDPVMQEDAIGCATCHVRDGAVLGPYGDTAAPHAVRKADELRSIDVCTQCHQASAYFPEQNLMCAFETGDEFRAGPYDDEGAVCQTCHMPEVERPLMAGFPARSTRRHWFGGSLIPKRPEYAAEVAALQPSYPHGMTLDWEDTDVQAGETLRARYANAEAGHRLPTGDPERWILVEAWIEQDGRTVAKSEERIGSVYEWWPTVKKLSDNRLAPREERSLALTVPADLSGEVTLRLRATKGRLSDEVMEFHDLHGKAVPSLVFVDETARATVSTR